MNTPKAIHHADAMRLLSDGRMHDLRLWELRTGDILHYPAARRMGRHTAGGVTRLLLIPSGQIRAMRDICLFEIDGLRVYL